MTTGWIGVNAMRAWKELEVQTPMDELKRKGDGG
jgi:hypothetical protein